MKSYNYSSLSNNDLFRKTNGISASNINIKF